MHLLTCTVMRPDAVTNLTVNYCLEEQLLIITWSDDMMMLAENYTVGYIATARNVNISTAVEFTNKSGLNVTGDFVQSGVTVVVSVVAGNSDGCSDVTIEMITIDGGES